MRLFLSAAICLVVASPALAQQGSGAFVVRLGRDTTAVERYTRTATRLESDAVIRAPRTTLRHVVADFGPDGRPTRVEIVLTAPGAAPGAPPIQRAVATFTRDSIIAEIRRDTTVVTRRLALPADGVVPVIGGASSSWLAFEMMVARLRTTPGDSLAVRVYNPGATALGSWSIKPWGRDSVWLYDGNNTFHARVDAAGHIVGATPLSGTQQFTVERVATADVAALGTAFAARDAQGQNLGILSTRDTINATVGGAALWIDYGRPAKRGRVVFGSNIVPWGDVWRTGANAATQFRTDHALELGGVTLPAGFYTLWSIPQPTGGWKLLINSQTGQWGTAHDPTKDLYQLDLATTALPQAVERFTISVAGTGAGGTINLDWDTTRASIAFVVR